MSTQDGWLKTQPSETIIATVQITVQRRKFFIHIVANTVIYQNIERRRIEIGFSKPSTKLLVQKRLTCSVSGLGWGSCVS